MQSTWYQESKEGNIMASLIILILIIGLILFFIVAGAVKMVIREELCKFKNDLIKEQRKINDKKCNLPL
jgi:hypothetical protein